MVIKKKSLSERKVLKIKSNKPQIEQSPSMDFQGQNMMANDNMDGGFGQQDDGQMSPMDINDMGDNNEFDTNFDPGVDADEEQDPKKFIQQLTGKLSQSLRKYNENNGQPDADLNKYVAGMITKQAMEGLSQDDANEIIDKIKADEDFSMEDDNNGNQNIEKGNDQTMQQMDNQMSMDNDNFNQFQQPNESRIKRGYKIDEIVNGVLNNIEDNKHPYQKTDNKKSFRKKPFSSPNFEN